VSGFLTGTGENFLLDLLCRAVVAPQSYWLALIANETPTHFLNGSELDEPTNSQYARAEYHNSPGNWTERSGEMSNTNVIEFPVITEDWPTIRHWGLLDSPESGNLLWAGSFENPIDLEIGDRLILPAGAITIRTTNYITRVSL